jgi:hypothetical protein
MEITEIPEYVPEASVYAALEAKHVTPVLSSLREHIREAVFSVYHCVRSGPRSRREGHIIRLTNNLPSHELGVAVSELLIELLDCSVRYKDGTFRIGLEAEVDLQRQIDSLQRELDHLRAKREKTVPE